jgi:hypothetical protein
MIMCHFFLTIPFSALDFGVLCFYLDNLFYLSVVENIDLQTNLGLKEYFL